MTDKQIIIDGVDVHWCEHYTGNIGYLTDKNWTCRAKIKGTKCEDWSNCYFKRWQRKEQESEQQLDQLNAELEQEKALKETYLACYKAKHEDIEGKLFKLSKTLTEIKTDILDIREGISYFWVIDKCDKILQKISECEVGNEKV